MGMVHCESCGDEILPEQETDYYDGDLYHQDCIEEQLEERIDAMDFQGGSDDSGS